MIKAKNWDGKDLQGTWYITYKIDGVRALWDGTQWLSRKGLPLYNIPDRTDGPLDIEVYCGSFKSTIEKVRTSTQSNPVDREHMYGLDPLDSRLLGHYCIDPSADLIKNAMLNAISTGFEGLVLRQDNTWLKVKPQETYDVLVTAVQAGKGKYRNKMGALMTPMGKVGTGFTDAERNMPLMDWLNLTIEVECMHLTADGKFRHPRFKRIRYDK